MTSLRDRRFGKKKWREKVWKFGFIFLLPPSPGHLSRAGDERQKVGTWDRLGFRTGIFTNGNGRTEKSRENIIEAFADFFHFRIMCEQRPVLLLQKVRYDMKGFWIDMIRLPKMIAYSPFLLFLGERLANIGPRMDGREESIIPSAYEILLGLVSWIAIKKVHSRIKFLPLGLITKLRSSLRAFKKWLDFEFPISAFFIWYTGKRMMMMIHPQLYLAIQYKLSARPSRLLCFSRRCGFRQKCLKNSIYFFGS